MSLTIQKAGTEDISLIQQLSNDIWHKVYPSIVSMEQIEYMLATWYSKEGLADQMTQQGHQFLLVRWNNEMVGYASYSAKTEDNPHRYRVHKLYLQPEMHGKGIGRAMLRFIAQETMPLGCKELELNVHKRNPAVGFYLHIGFSIEQDIVTVIEHGHVLDDYIMLLDLSLL